MEGTEAVRGGVAGVSLRAWLGGFVSEDGYRPKLGQVWRGASFLCATNGNVLVAIPDDGEAAGEMPDSNPPLVERALGWLAADLDNPREFGMDVLREWCGPLTVPCSECRHPRPADIKESAMELDRTGRIGGTIFNVRLLGHVLRDAPGEAVTLSEQEDPEHAIQVRGDGWRALIMPLCPGFESKERRDIDEIPALPTSSGGTHQSREEG